MAVKSLLENLDEVPELLRPEYKETEIAGVGKRFVLDIDGVDQHPLVRGLKSAHDKTKADKDKYKAEYEAASVRVKDLPDDFTPEEYLRLKQAEADGKGPDVDKRLADLRTELEKKRLIDLTNKDKDIGDRETRISFLTKTIEKRVVDDGLTSALIDVGVTKELLPAARALLKERGVVHFVEDEGRFDAIAKTDTLGDVDVPTYIKEWAKGDEGKAFVPKPTGGGAPGGGPGGRQTGDNPFSHANWNVTAQGRMVTERGIDYANRMAAAAGTIVGGPKPAPRAAA